MIHNILKEYQMMEFLEFAVETVRLSSAPEYQFSCFNQTEPSAGNVQCKAALKEKKKFQ